MEFVIHTCKLPLHHWYWQNFDIIFNNLNSKRKTTVYLFVEYLIYLLLLFATYWVELINFTVWPKWWSASICEHWIDWIQLKTRTRKQLSTIEWQKTYIYAQYKYTPHTSVSLGYKNYKSYYPAIKTIFGIVMVIIDNF